MDRTRRLALMGTAAAAMGGGPAWAADEAVAAVGDKSDIIVTGELSEPTAGTKTATPLIETPQPITIITEDMFRAQGAVNVSDTLRYVAGVTSNAYGLDSRVDSNLIRGIDPLQFRDGMRDLFSYYASITADPYNFSRVEVVRGPASVLFGQSSIGGIVNLVSKTPEFETRGEIQAVYGSFDRKELMVDVTGPLTDTLAARVVGRLRDADTQTDHVADDRVFVSPSLRWRPGEDTDVTLIGLYQEDDGGSTAQFLPIAGTLFDNPGNPHLPNDLFIGKPGWDRYGGRLLEGTAIATHRVSDEVQFSLKVRYIDSDLTYLTHYPDSYGNPANPYVEGSNGRVIGLYADGSVARMNVFSTDNNVQFKFDTGAHVEHVLLAGVDYSWNKVRKRGGYGYEFIDIYDIDYDALSDYGGGVPSGQSYETRETQKQLGFYVQDQSRFWDRVSLVLGARHDKVKSRATSAPDQDDDATTFRAGIIGEIGAGFSPFFSYTESFLPVAGLTGDGTPFKPQRGTQYEVGMKWQPNPNALVTVTGFHIKESNRPIDDPANPLQQIQAGELTTKGFEVEAIYNLPGNFDLIANYGYNKVSTKDTPSFSYVPKHNASIWGTRTVALDDDLSLRLGAGVRYTGKSVSEGYGGIDPDSELPFNWTIDTPHYTLVDALVSVQAKQWSFSLNATNLLNKKFYASCLARGDCFIGAERNIMGTLAFRF